eukprot:g22589.t1
MTIETIFQWFQNAADQDSAKIPKDSPKNGWRLDMAGGANGLFGSLLPPGVWMEDVRVTGRQTAGGSDRAKEGRVKWKKVKKKRRIRPQAATALASLNQSQRHGDKTQWRVEDQNEYLQLCAKALSNPEDRQKAVEAVKELLRAGANPEAEMEDEDDTAMDFLAKDFGAAWLQHRASTLLEILLSVTNALLLCVVSYECHNFTGSRWALWAAAASTAKEAIQILPVMWRELSLNLLPDIIYVGAGVLALVPRMGAQALEELPCGPSMALLCSLSWLRLLFAMRGERWLGPRFLPIMFALRDTFAFFLVALLCLTASAHAYYVLNARGTDPFPVYSSITQTLRLGMFGDFDLFEFQGQDTTFHRSGSVSGSVWEPVDPTPQELGLEQYVYIQVVFYLTGIGITILLMNLLIGVLGQNYELYQDQAPQLFTRARAAMLLKHQDRPWFILAGWLQPWRSCDESSRPECWIRVLVSPLHLALGESGKFLVAQNFQLFFKANLFYKLLILLFAPIFLIGGFSLARGPLAVAVGSAAQLCFRDGIPEAERKNLSNDGVSYPVGIFLEEAHRREGLSLDFYRDYNVSWHDPSRYFTSPDQIDKNRLLPCTETILMNSRLMQLYHEFTGDDEGVIVRGSGDVIGKCFDGYFWLAPGCRSNSSKCITFITGGSGWSGNEHMQKAAFLSMPLAWTVGKTWNDFTTLPMDYTTMFYWWTPDTTFLRLDAKSLIFPPHDWREFERGMLRSTATSISIDKYISQDPSRNEDVFVSNRSDPRGLTCKICPSGHFSEPIEDLNGTTFVCQPCAAGKYQASKASTECEPCGKGEYQDQIGRSSCQRCGFGEYQDVPGQSSCIACPSQTSTVGFGSVSMADCGCLERTINVASSNSAFDCRSCSVGLKCPFGSTLQSLRTGQVPDGSSLSAEYVPQVLEGYYAEQEEPLVLYTCKPATNCPGGKPGECAGGLLDKPCSVCAEGKAWNGQECTECGDVAIFVWAFGLLLSLVVLLQAYDFVASHSTAEATSFQACAFAFGIAANMVQSLAIFGLMSMTWTSSVSSTTNFLRVALLDLDQLGFGCITGSNSLLRYMSSGMIFPMVSICLLLRWSFSYMVQRMPRACAYPPWCPMWLRFGARRWRFFKTFNTMGAFYQIGFATLSAQTFQPLMCYSHPNGSQSLLEFPSTFCGDTEQIIMAVFGVVVVVAGFFILCLVAVLQMPRWSVKHHRERVQAFTFLTNKFRFNVWWFGMALLARGFALSVTVVVGSDVPELQVALASVILLLYLCVLVRFWPWKASILNYADAAVCSCLLLLINLSRDASLPSTIFTDDFSMVMLCLLAAFVATTGILCVSALILSKCKNGGAGERRDRFRQVGHVRMSHCQSRQMMQLRQALSSSMMSGVASETLHHRPDEAEEKPVEAAPRWTLTPSDSTETGEHEDSQENRAEPNEEDADEDGFLEKS